MEFYLSPNEYLFNLHTLSSQDAKRLWRKSIKEKWDNKCAYCGSEEDLTIDHIIPQRKGGNTVITNVVSCCSSCNKSKGHSDWEEWFSSQHFFTEDRKNAIVEWIGRKNPQQLYTYRQRKNKVF